MPASQRGMSEGLIEFEGGDGAVVFIKVRLMKCLAGRSLRWAESIGGAYLCTCALVLLSRGECVRENGEGEMGCV